MTASLALVLDVSDFTLLPAHRLSTLYDAAHAVMKERIGGAFVECGVMNGGSAAVLAKAIAECEARQLWLFDSFQGVPQPTAKDRPDEEQGHLADALAGTCIGRRESVVAVLSRVGAVIKNVHIEAGWFSDTLPKAATGPIALLHMDADFYVATRTILAALYSRVVSGGMVIVDDYGRWPGCAAAVTECLQAAEVTPELHVTDGCQMWFRKP